MPSTPALGVTTYTNVSPYKSAFQRPLLTAKQKQTNGVQHTNTYTHTHIHGYIHTCYITKRGAAIHCDKNRHSYLEVEVLVVTAINSKACATSNSSSTTTRTTVKFGLSQKQRTHVNM